VEQRSTELTSTLELVAVLAGDVTPERWYAVLRPATAYDLPNIHPWTAELAIGRIRHPRPGEEAHRWLATVDGVDVGGVALQLPLVDNTATALVDLFVLPEHRRRGIGTRLLEHAVEQARAAGRTRMFAEAGAALDQQTSPGMAFLERHGFVAALGDLLSQLHLDRLDESAVEAMAADARVMSSGYALEVWQGPPATDEVCAQLGHLEGTLSEDAPLGDLEWERENWDADRVRGAAESLQRMGLHSFHGVARDTTGRIVAWTNLVACPSEPMWAMQWATVVEPDHRGHRLGALVKTANLAELRRALPQTRIIETGNAEVNEHMLRVNRAMGFEPAARFWEYQRTL